MKQPLTEADAHTPAPAVHETDRPLRLVTNTDRARTNMLKVLDEVRAKVEAGGVRDLVLAYYTEDRVLSMRDVLTTGTLHGIGMAAELTEAIRRRD